MKRLTGLVASNGIAIGKVFPIFDRQNTDIPLYSINKEDISNEKERLDKAISSSMQELKKILDNSNQSSKDEVDILTTHLVMLSDAEFIKNVYTSLEESMLNIEAVLDRKIDEYASMLAASKSSYIRERALDIKDAFEVVFDKLICSREKNNRFVNVPENAIIVARDIMTSEVLSLKSAGVKGIVMEEGGVHGHISIIARSWGIPMLVSTTHVMEYAISGLLACLDAENGVVVFNPSREEIEEYENRIRLSNEKLNEIIKNASFNAGMLKTIDGTHVTVSANIAFKEESMSQSMVVSDGVGLFRTEFLFLQDDVIPSEEVQQEVYSSVVLSLKDKPLIIRTFDAGSDKMLKEQESLHEKNPLLGWRAIRYCFARPKIFRTQLRAILKSSAFGNVSILIPMICSIEEVRKVRTILEEEKIQLAQEGVKFNKDIPLGIMVEVPSVAVATDLFAPYVDFMSIGTNDLVQYVMAVDRENGKVASLANYFEPSILRLIKNAIDSSAYSNNENYFVSMCGEMASNKEAVFLLLGMGLRHFSMPSWKIYEMKNFIASVDIAKAVEVYNRVSYMSSPNDILKFIKNTLES